ncbi:MAG: hypothetical protein JKY50_00545 [Oleispira sp.]|nr:hypothetical protein [Oleispira sp.]
MNNYHDQSENEPVECNVCHTSMIESCNGNFLICENVQCDNEIKLEGEGDE